MKTGLMMESLMISGLETSLRWDGPTTESLMMSRLEASLRQVGEHETPESDVCAPYARADDDALFHSQSGRQTSAPWLVKCESLGTLILAQLRLCLMHWQHMAEPQMAELEIANTRDESIPGRPGKYHLAKKMDLLMMREISLDQEDGPPNNGPPNKEWARDESDNKWTRDESSAGWRRQWKPGDKWTHDVSTTGPKTQLLLQEDFAHC
ncbi:hypothetical protein PG984_006959 [Apiospora sp. TS-2023a]